MRANCPLGRIAQLHQLMLDPRTAGWADEDFAHCLCTSIRSVRRWKRWLRQYGYLPEIGSFWKHHVG
jgi:hypothetical protein